MGSSAKSTFGMDRLPRKSSFRKHALTPTRQQYPRLAPKARSSECNKRKSAYNSQQDKFRQCLFRDHFNWS
ncbi:hypothetical protein GN956_G4980 [Arapaima gigas]